MHCEARRAAYMLLMAWGFDFRAARACNKNASQLGHFVSVDPWNKSAKLKVRNLKLQRFSSGYCEKYKVS